jgi:hypothetical protein
MNDDGRRDGGLTDFAGRLIRAGADVVNAGAERIREKGDEFPKASDLLSGAAKLSARGKEEIVTLVANEVRSYMEKLRVGEEIEKFLESHELQINIKLKPTERPPKPEAADPPAESED